MLIHECTPVDELFSHEDTDGVTRHFNASAMTRSVLAGTTTPTYATLALYPDLVASIEANHGVEQDHLEKVAGSLDTIILLVEFTDGSNLVVDGNHRIVKRWREGLRDVKAAIFKPGQWEPFLVTDVHLPRWMYTPKEKA